MEKDRGACLTNQPTQQSIQADDDDILGLEIAKKEYFLLFCFGWLFKEFQQNS